MVILMYFYGGLGLGLGLCQHFTYGAGRCVVFGLALSL